MSWKHLRQRFRFPRCRPRRPSPFRPKLSGPLRPKSKTTFGPSCDRNCTKNRWGKSLSNLYTLRDLIWAGFVGLLLSPATNCGEVSEVNKSLSRLQSDWVESRPMSELHARIPGQSHAGEWHSLTSLPRGGQRNPLSTKHVRLHPLRYLTKNYIVKT